MAHLEGADEVVVDPVALGGHLEEEVQLGRVGDDIFVGFGKRLHQGCRGGGGQGCRRRRRQAARLEAQKEPKN